MKNSIVKKSYLFLGILFIFLIWIFGQYYVDNSYVVPSVIDTFEALIDLLKQSHTYKVLGYTLLRLIISILVCFVLGLLLAVLSYKFKGFKWFIKPLITLLKTLPIAVVIILLLAHLGRNLAPFYIIGVVVLPVVYEAILIGLENIDLDVLDEVKLISKTTPKVLFRVHLPIIFPALLTAVIQSIGLGLKVLVMAEYMSQPKYSIGNEIVYYKDVIAEMQYVFAWSIILILFVLLVEVFISYVSKKKELVL